MNYADEAYVRLYLRDTINWKMLKWEGKCVIVLLIRKVDRAGVLDLGEFSDEMAKAVAALIELPEDVVEAGLANIIKHKSIVRSGQFLVMPNFIEAQEAVQSDRVRKAEQRARHRDRTLAISRGLVTNRDAVTPRDIEPPAVDDGSIDSAHVTPRDSSVTQRDGESRDGTKCPPTPLGRPGPPTLSHSSSAELSLAEQSSAVLDADGSILRELKNQSCLASVANVDTATMLARRFATIEIQRGAKLEWAINAIGECAADSAGLGLKPEALLKKLRAYVDHARAPRAADEKSNGRSRYSHSDAVITTPKPTEAELEANRQRAKARIEGIKARHAAAQGGKKE